MTVDEGRVHFAKGVAKVAAAVTMAVEMAVVERNDKNFEAMATRASKSPLDAAPLDHSAVTVPAAAVHVYQ